MFFLVVLSDVSMFTYVMFFGSAEEALPKNIRYVNTPFLATHLQLLMRSQRPSGKCAVFRGACGSQAW